MRANSNPSHLSSLSFVGPPLAGVPSSPAPARPQGPTLQVGNRHNTNSWISPSALQSFSLLVTLAFTVLLTLTGCARREAPVDAGLRTQTLLIGNGAEPADLDPHTATILSDQNILMALFEGLTALDEQTTTPVPAAAERWENSLDGLTWTFHLRANLKWSNSEALLAQDFVDAWRRALNPTLAADNASYLYAVKNAEAYNTGKLTDPAALGFSAPDARTIIITLAQPTPYLPALVSLPAWFPINPRALAKFSGMEKRNTAWTRAGNLVGNGAFTLKEWTTNVRILVEKNPHHWAAATTQLQQIAFIPIENPDAEERAFRSGQLHVTFNLPVSKIAAWRDKEPAKLRLDPLLQSVFFRFNVTKPPFDNPKIRRALSLAIDRDLLARTILQASRLPAHALTPPHTGGYTARAAVGPDFQTARHLLAEAGFPQGAGLPVIELQTKNDELMPRLAEAMQATWQSELGVRTTITQTEQKIWIQNQQTLAYTISTASWTADFPDPVTFLGLFTSESSYNWTGWKNPAYDQLITAAAATINPRRRYEIFQQAEQLLLEDSPIAPLYFGAQTYLLHPAVQSWMPSPLVFRRYQKVSLTPP